MPTRNPSPWQARLRNDPAGLRDLMDTATAAFRFASKDGRSRFPWRDKWFVAHATVFRLFVDDDDGLPVAERYW
jgi:hypothetical protein